MVGIRGKRQRLDLQGSVTAVSCDDSSARFLVATANNDAILLAPDGHNEFMDTRCIKQELHKQAFVMAAHLMQNVQKDCVVLGTSSGQSALVAFNGSGRDPTVSTFGSDQQAGGAVVDYAQFHGRTSFAWCNSEKCYISDAARGGDVIAALDAPPQNIIGLTATGRNEVAIAGSDGQLLLYDLRCGTSPTVGLEFDDVFTAISSDSKGNIACGTAMGRIVRMRGSSEATCREVAFGAFKQRSAITSLSVAGEFCVCGGEDDRVCLIDLHDDAEETQTWNLGGPVVAVGLCQRGLLGASYVEGGISELSLLSLNV